VSVTGGFAKTGGLPDLISVDCIGLQIWHTTPAVRPGTLTLSFKNLETGATQYQCVRDAVLDPPENGNRAGLEIVGSATFDFAEAAFNYHQSEKLPNCPKCNCHTGGGFPGGGSCEACCSPEFPPSFIYVLDLSALALTPDAGCAAACGWAGLLVLNQLYLAGQFQPCIWQMYHTGLSDFGRPAPIYITCNDTPPVERVRIYSQLLLVQSPCRWLATVVIEGEQRLGGSDRDWRLVSHSRADYESDPLPSMEACADMPVTLNKTGEQHGIPLADPPLPGTCAGSFPATIELDIPSSP
jgi:hypothetical protein